MSKYKFIKIDQELDDNDILQTKDFNSLLRNYRGYQLKILSIKVVVFISILALAILLFMNRFKPQMTEDKVIIPFSEDTIVVENTIPDKPGNPVGKSPGDKIIKESDKQKKEQSSESNLAMEYRQAIPQNGYDKLYDFFNQNLQLPDTISLANDIEVMVTCTIDKDGNAKNIDVLQGSSHIIIKETKRLVKEMPPWHPAIIAGDTVASSVSFSLRYIIK